MKNKTQKPHLKSKKEHNYEKEHVIGDVGKGSEKRINMLVGELKALLTCPHEFYFLERLLSRTIIMLKKEPALKRLWEEAYEYHRKTSLQRKDLLDELNELRKELKLDKVCPSLIGIDSIGMIEMGKMEHGKPILFKRYLQKPVPDEFSVKWIGEARDWILSKSKNGLSGRDEQEFFSLTTMWDYYESRRYPVGQHPVETLALLECLCDRINFLFNNDATFSPMTHLDVTKDLRREVEQVITNLIAELPIIKSWGKFSVAAIDWKRVATNMAREIWNNRKTQSRKEVASLILPTVQKWGVNENTLIQHLAAIDPRLPEERKQAQLRKPK